jgi:hypothetical protein
VPFFSALKNCHGYLSALQRSTACLLRSWAQFTLSAWAAIGFDLPKGWGAAFQIVSFSNFAPA